MTPHPPASSAGATFPDYLRRRFRFAEHGTGFRRETIGGLTTFATMAYIIVVNPAILRVAGIPADAAMVATILTAVFGTLLMALYANRPFAIAPYMGANAFIAYTVVVGLGIPWQQALGAVFMAGALFGVLTVLKLRQWLVRAIPIGLRYSFAAGIGLFLAFVGLNEMGVVALGQPGAPLRAGDLTAAPVLVAIGGFLIIAVLMIRRVPGAILLGILATAGLAFLTGVTPLPEGVVSLPPSLAPTFLELELRGLFTWTMFPIVLTIFVIVFADTMATLIGVSARAGFLDENGELPQIERPMLADALSTMFAPVVGTTTSGAFIESAAGVEAGGRTGFTSLVTAACFAAALFFAPVATAIPPQAYGPALVAVGLLMLSPINRIDFGDLSELIPAFGVVALMSFTFNVAVGLTAGFVLYPLCKLAAGRAREVRAGMWVLGGLSLLFFIFYPYG
jgi:adenine/guanine/hypoxanthine permease